MGLLVTVAPVLGSTQPPDPPTVALTLPAKSPTQATTFPVVRTPTDSRPMAMPDQMQSAASTKRARDKPTKAPPTALVASAKRNQKTRDRAPAGTEPM